ncbi:4-alpha-glucanotransferase [Dyella sedimenti]|uniref:4-alpha-glucanotransferase n=1 Tax=Dyella sedimenti TaxID=2919947 RepID=UPI001FAAA3F3|nr:4-alpha-glucanotransferase [Dyella sedimenti]
MNRPLQQRARDAGIEVSWTDAQGQPRELSPETIDALLQVLESHAPSAQPGLRVATAGAALPPACSAREAYCLDTRRHVPLARDAQGRVRAPGQPGHYQLGGLPGDGMLAVAPPRCFTAADLPGPADRAWGVTAQVYGLRRPGDGGLGDSQAVAALGRHIAAAGGDAVGLSPLHAMSPPTADFSPYAPSHRAWLDTLQIAPAQVLGTEALHEALEHGGQTPAWARAERRPLIDWPAQDAMRQQAWDHLVQRYAGQGALQRALADFIADGGDSLRLHAIFAAHQRLARTRGESPDWRHWGHAWRDGRHAEMAAFAGRHATAVERELFLQWLAARCWDDTQAQLRAAGQRIGLVWDLAAGFEPGGSEAWRYRELVVEGAHIGAPPDAFNPDGQDWGLAAYSPAALRRSGYAPVREWLGRMMPRGGGLRIDHILGWSRLWLIPGGMSPREGGYVRYPQHDLLGLLALASWRHRCLVIGEDLGTVPADLRQVLAGHGVYGMDVLPFTRDAQGGFVPPAQWRRHAVAMSSTHDLPPLAGWRAGTDLDALARVHGWNGGTLADARKQRQHDMAKLDRLLQSFPARSPRQAALRAVAESASALALFPLEDVLAERLQPNLPGTVPSQYPNWRRRLSWRLPRLDATLRWIARHRRTHADA